MSVRAGVRLLCGLSVTVLVACGGSGGEPSVDCAPCVVTGFSGNLDWEHSHSEGSGGVGDGADGGGGVGGGAGYGQFRKALVVVKFPDGSPVGQALTDDITGMVTIKPGRTYEGPLLVEVHGQPDATYFEEGKNKYVPYEPGRVQHAVIPFINRNIGITPFTEAAYQLSVFCQSGLGPPTICDPGTATPFAMAGKFHETASQRPRERKAEGTATVPSASAIAAANAHVTRILNQQLPASLQVDDITRLPFIVNDATQDEIRTTPRGRYGLANIAFSKQAAMYNSASAAPTLLAVAQLSNDLRDGKLDGRNGNSPAAAAALRTYDPQTLTSEFSAALAQQTTRYGHSESLAAMPLITSFGNTRYDSYYFDATLEPNGATSTIAVATEAAAPTREPGAKRTYVDAAHRGFMLFGNMGSGSLFIKTDSPDSTSSILAIGDNHNGELGNGTDHATGREGASTISLPGVMTHAAGGVAHTVARLSDGSVYAWGDNTYGQLGQGGGGVAGGRSLQPLRVNLPSGALAVAAANQASFALLEDSSVYSWGSAWGFGTLGNGTESGERSSPGPVMSTDGPLTGVVQISARDNDVLALKADGTIWTWGAFSAEVPVIADQILDRRAGYVQAKLFSGLPVTTGGVRKVLTEQGLFVALLAGTDANGADLDGAVYSWGIHFDITAGQVLPDQQPRRVLNLPPVRDLMPGGFLGYGQRPADRLTAMGIDYNGGLWKIRGRVAEQYDPANPISQRRPLGEPRGDKCDSCHVVRPKELPPVPSLGPVCNVPTDILTLLTTQSNCQNCHNSGTLASGRSLGPLTCTPPPLKARGESERVKIFPNGCQLSAVHPVVKATSSCASCHNGVTRRPLECAPPEEPTGPASGNVAAINGAFDDRQPGTGPISDGGITNDTTPTLSGTLSTPLVAGDAVKVLMGLSDVRPENRTVIGTAAAAVGAATWQFAPSSMLAPGVYVFSVRVDRDHASPGTLQGAFRMEIVEVIPEKPARITSIKDDAGRIVSAVDTPTNDSTPTVEGQLEGTLANERLILRRVGPDGTRDFEIPQPGSRWIYVEPTGLPDGTYTYVAEVVPNGSPGTFAGATTPVVIDTTAPTAKPVIKVEADAPEVSIKSVTAGTRPSGYGISDSTVQLSATVPSGLQAGDKVEFRVAIGLNPPIRVPDSEPVEAGLAVKHVVPEANALLGLGNTLPTGEPITVTYSARLVDKAGNVSSIQSDPSVHLVGLFSCQKLREHKESHLKYGEICSSCHLQEPKLTTPHGTHQYLPGDLRKAPESPTPGGYWCTFGSNFAPVPPPPTPSATISPFGTRN